MRGKDTALTDADSATGITPAYAGKSLTILQLTTGSRDHPRVCGEKAFGRASPRGPKGSPPRMRGKVAVNSFNYNAGRITPAYAGKRCI